MCVVLFYVLPSIYVESLMLQHIFMWEVYHVTSLHRSTFNHEAMTRATFDRLAAVTDLPPNYLINRVLCLHVPGADFEHSRAAVERSAASQCKKTIPSSACEYTSSFGMPKPLHCKLCCQIFRLWTLLATEKAYRFIDPNILISFRTCSKIHTKISWSKWSKSCSQN